jgi:DNA repair protein RadA/Sms
MSKKLIQQYICQQCGATHNKWNGKCLDCGSWNSLVEEVVVKGKTLLEKKAANSVEIYELDENVLEVERVSTKIEEFDRVLGGGLVEGAAILLGGDPGIGKSTLVLQLLSRLCEQNLDVLYLSGEESFQQIKLRAARIGVAQKGIKISCLTSLQEIKASVDQLEKLNLIVIDSIQTIYDEYIESSPGSVSQVKSCAFELIRMAKQRGFAVLFIGHVTKEGAIAGPKILEHMVDTVLYFEGDRGMQYRMIRAIKNRFGPANEIAVFEMADNGLSEVSNPSKYFLSTSTQEASGSCIFANVEGTRPLLLEVQALCVPSYLPSPRRAVIGWDNNRLAMLIAVLNSRLNINILDKEVYLNMVGGLKVSEPAADLAVVASLISASKNIPINRDYVFFGEVGLSGEVRSVSQTEARLIEADKLGFKYAVMPRIDKNFSCKIEVIHVNHIKDLLKLL